MAVFAGHLVDASHFTVMQISKFRDLEARDRTGPLTPCLSHPLTLLHSKPLTFRNSRPQSLVKLLLHTVPI